MSVLVEQLLVSLVLLGVRLAQNLLRAWRVVVPILVGGGTVVLLSPLVGWAVAVFVVAFVGMASVAFVGLPSRRHNEWPLLKSRSVSLWDPVPFGPGVDLLLPYRSLLIGGIPNAGKSYSLRPIIAAAVLDPNTKVYLIDRKFGIEFNTWRDVADMFADDLDHAIVILEHVCTEIAARGRELAAHGLEKVERGDSLSLLVIDELAQLVQTTGEKGEDAKRRRFAALLLEIVSLGRAEGVIVVAATQKPMASVIPSELRDLFGYRLALRCTSPQMSDTILGSQWASMGANAARLPKEPGVGYLLTDDADPQRVRAFALTKPQLSMIAERAAT